MRTWSEDFNNAETAENKEPRLIYVQSWDTADTDKTYFTSSADALVPVASPAVDEIVGVIQSVSGQTQKINPDIATSTIGSVTLSLVDVGEAITDKIQAKDAGGDGLRGKVGRLYIGYNDMAFSDYDLRLTYIVDSVSYQNGVYTFTLSDIQREERKKIFDPDESTLDSSITATDTIIPITGTDATLFTTVTHGSEWTTRPGESVGYIKINDEVICHDSGLQFDTTNGWHVNAIERGALNTRARAHNVNTSQTDSRKPKVTEHIFLEGPAPKVIYALQTGTLLNGASPEDTLPDHWSLGIDTAFVRLSDYQGLGDDYWNTTDDSGRFVRIENPGPQDGKRYIEKELLLWLGAFQPIYTTGEIGIKKLVGVLSDSAHVAQLGEDNVVAYSGLKHAYDRVMNDIRVNWNWVDSKRDFTKPTALIDADSIAKHGRAKITEFNFKTVHTGLHTDEDLLTYFDVLRDRYSGPPMLLNLTLLPSMSALEVGDPVRVVLPQIRDMYTGTTLDRTFEVQQISTNWQTGALKVSLFASSQAAGALTRTTLSSVLNDSFYTGLGTELSTVLTITGGAVTANGTLNGHASDVDNSAAVFYYDGDLTINPGVTVTINDNVQLRIKGTLQVNGTIDGIGNGPAGGAATTQFVGGGTSDTYNHLTSIGAYDPIKDLDFNAGGSGYFGSTLSPANFYSLGFGGATPSNDSLMNLNPIQGRTVGVSRVPWFQLVNDTSTDTISGYPGNLTGTPGVSGVPFMHTSMIFGTWNATRYIKSNGGAGGAGGAGLLIVARGLAFGVSGKIDLSGGDSSNGTGYTHVASGNIHYGSSGAAGAPGALLIFMDGNATNPDITSSRFVANYGDIPKPASAVELGLADLQKIAPVSIGGLHIKVWPYAQSTFNAGDWAGVENRSMTDSAHRLQYLPPDETVSIDDLSFPGISPGEHRIVNNFQRQSPPADGETYGRGCKVVDNGSRCFCAFVDQSVSPTETAIHIVRGVSNVEHETVLSDPSYQLGNNFADKIEISELGDRVFANAWDQTISAVAHAGQMYCWRRSGQTWTFEKTFAPGTPLDSDYSYEFTVDADGSHLALNRGHVGAGSPDYNQVHYWNRSGTTWTDRGTIPKPAGASITLFGDGLAMSGDGTHLLVGDGGYDTTTTNTGAAWLYSRSGNTWTRYTTDLIPLDDGFAYLWGLGGSTGKVCAIDREGVAFAFSSNVRVNGVGGRVAVYLRTGSNFELIQIIDGPTTGTSSDIIGRSIYMSDDGLMLLINNAKDDTGLLYKRGARNQEFRLFQTFDSPNFNSADQSWHLARRGIYVAAGDKNSFLNCPACSFAPGEFLAWQFHPEPV